MGKWPSYLNILYLLRMAAVGVVFAVVSIGVMPVFLIRSGDTRNNKIFCNAINFLLLKILGIKLAVDTTEAVYNQRSAVVIANHQGVMDVISCGAVLPKRSSTLGKQSLGWIPVWGTIFRRGGNILVNRGDSTARRQAMQKLTDVIRKNKASLWVFPEGTRNKSNRIRRFHDGAFRCAQLNKTCIQPVVISTYNGIVNLKKWRAGTIAIKVLPPVEMGAETDTSIGAVVERVKDLMQAEIDRLDLLALSGS